MATQAAPTRTEDRQPWRVSWRVLMPSWAGPTARVAESRAATAADGADVVLFDQMWDQ
jgi:hypothetical protein